MLSASFMGGSILNSTFEFAQVPILPAIFPCKLPPRHVERLSYVVATFPLLYQLAGVAAPPRVSVHQVTPEVTWKGESATQGASVFDGAPGASNRERPEGRNRGVRSNAVVADRPSCAWRIRHYLVINGVGEGRKCNPSR